MAYTPSWKRGDAVHPRPLIVLALSIVLCPGLALADEIGRIKVVKGGVHVERGGGRVTAAVGTRLREGDVVVTGRDGAVGITLDDDSLLSAGPDSRLALDRFAFDSTTHAGRLETTLQQGTLAAVSGKIARQSPDAMRVRTPVSSLAVRGTEFGVHSRPVGP
jgi:hypothetical protein